jgi:peroxiredoxin
MKKWNAPTTCLMFFVLFLQGILLKGIEYGDKICPITLGDCQGNNLSINNNSGVSVLFFFNAEDESLSQILEKLNPLFVGLQEQRKNVNLYFISKSEKQAFITLIEKHKLKFPVINDTEEKLFSQFNYVCGVCVKVVILDKKGVIRYLAEHIDMDFIQSVAE